ncbi:UNVERIFIED_CONTAM: hypothetical protein FKN15_044704 [Acipenser sinensis]
MYSYMNHITGRTAGELLLTQTVTRTVPVPTALLGDLRQCLQGTPVANNRANPAGRGNAGRGRAPEGWQPQTPFSAQQLQYWHTCTSDTWVLGTVHNGYSLEFCLGPCPFRGITNTFVSDPLQAYVLQ